MAIQLGVSACDTPDRPPPLMQEEPTPPLQRVPERSDAFEATACPVDPPNGYAADCGIVRVSESEAGSPDVELAVMVLYSPSQAPADPVVYLEGGPGSSAIVLTQYAGPFIFEPILEQRDLILVDQRGTGFSSPALFCNSRLVDSFEEELELVEDCRQTWASRDVDLSQYNTRQNARDIERVREALGYDSWNVYGISYGSRLALTVARDFPQSIRSLIIDGVLPLQVDLLAEGTPSLSASLEALNLSCREQASCEEAYGDIVDKLFASVDRLQATPVELSVGPGESVSLTGELAFNIVSQLLYVAELLPYLPALITQVYEEDYSLFEELVGGLTGESGLAVGMYYSVTCQDEAAFTSHETIEEARAELDPHYVLGFDAKLLMDVCDVWAVPASPASENQAVESTVPSLVLSGAYDPVTPPRFGALAAEGLENAQEFVLPDQAHGASISSCGMNLVTSFLQDPEVPLSDPCLGRLGPPGFVAGSEPLRVPTPALHFEVPVRWDEALIERLKRAMLRQPRAFPKRSWNRH